MCSQWGLIYNDPERKIERFAGKRKDWLTKDRICRTCVLRNVHSETETTVTVGAKEKSEHYLCLSFSLCLLQHAFLFLLYHAASPHLFFFSTFLRKQTDLLSRPPPSLSIKGERKGDLSERSGDTKK